MDTNLLRENDIMLATYPRSGNTWVINLLMYLGILVLAGRYHSLDIERAIDIPDEPSEYIPALQELKSIRGDRILPYRVIKTHDRYKPNFYHKAINMIRDGRDVMVSYYYYSKRFNNFEGSFLDFLNLSPSPASEWAEHVESWLSAQEADVLYLRYENLKKNPFREIQAMLNFLNEARSDSDIQDAISICSFQNLSKHERTVESSLIQDPNLRFFRKGSVADWKNVFRPEHISKFKQGANPMLLKLGYEESPNW